MSREQFTVFTFYYCYALTLCNYNFLQHGQCSWMEMHQFIGDLLTSGNSSKDQSDVLNATWGGAAARAGGGGDALGFKSASLEPLQQPRPVRVESGAEPVRRLQPVASQRKGEARERREGKHSKEALSLQILFVCM